jgi:hypothetical protein
MSALITTATMITVKIPVASTYALQAVTGIWSPK